MIIITMMTVLAIILFLALILSIISRLNSLSNQRDRIIKKITQATEEENKLKEQASTPAN